MTRYLTTMIDDSGIELNITYTMEHVPSHIEEGHGYHELGNYDIIELDGVELDIYGQTINILDKLGKHQQENIKEFINSQF